MSRIHEALKKAEQERAMVQTPDTAASPPDTPVAAPAWESGAPSVATVTAPPDVHTAAPLSDYLRFEEVRTHGVRAQWHLDPNVNVFLNTSLSAHGAEQFRTLRSRLYQIRSSQTLRTLLVTSSVPAEGKTFVTTNLAQAIVRQPDRRVLMIDADLRCARLHVPLGAPSSPGLADYLVGDVDEMQVIQSAQEANLCLIPGGKQVSNPSELLSNGRFKKLLDRVTPVFDWVIIDSPPCLPIADASILADVCDGVLLVVRAASTPSEVAQRACQELQGRNIVGVVLNAVDEDHLHGSSYYYQHYGYGHGQTDSKAVAAK
jgi:capsular exopolysaccharide synthesis family protein